MSFTHDSTRVLDHGIVQWNAQFDATLYENFNRIRQGQQSGNFIELYPPAVDPRDYGIMQGEILLTLRGPFRGMGGGVFDLQSASRQYNQEPMVFSSLNGLMVLKSQVPGGAVLTDDAKRAQTNSMVRVIGIAKKNHALLPSPDKAKDPPVIITSGPVTMVNTGQENITVGDIVCAWAPNVGDKPAIRDHKNGLSLSKRTYVPKPYRGLPSRSAKDLRSKLLATPLDKPLSKPVQVVDNDFLLKALGDFARAIAVSTIAETSIATAVAGGGNLNDQARAAEWTAAAAMVDRDDNAKRLVQLLSVLATPNMKFAPETVQNKLKGSLDFALAALGQAFAQDQEFILGRAMSSARTGERFDLNLERF